MNWHLLFMDQDRTIGMEFLQREVMRQRRLLSGMVEFISNSLEEKQAEEFKQLVFIVAGEVPDQPVEDWLKDKEDQYAVGKLPHVYTFSPGKVFCWLAFIILLCGIMFMGWQ